MTAAASTPEPPEADEAKVEPTKSQPKEEALDTTSKPAEKPAGRSIKVVDASEGPDEAESLEEVNESLKAMAPDLGELPIEKITDEAADVDVPMSDEIADELVAEAKQPVVPEEPVDENPEASESEAETDDEATQPEPVEPEPTKELSEVETEEGDDGLPDDEATREAVDEIVAEESDAVMAAEDLALELENETVLTTEKKVSWFKRLLSSSRGRWAVMGGLFILCLAVAGVPNSRYFVLNGLGVRSSLSLHVIDRETRQPLKNVSVQAGGSNAKTDGDGNVKLENLRLGRTTLQIDKRAFSSISRPITIGWGSNPLGEFEAEAVGSSYSFVVKDFLSGKPIAGAAASSGDGDAVSDEEGNLVLRLDTAELDDSTVLEVNITADGYRQEMIELPVNNRETQDVAMVPDHKHVFVSKRSGKYDVYSIDADGKNEQKIVEGSGIERDDITLVPHQSLDVAALMSTRERVTNSSGYLLSTLYVMNTRDGNLVKIDQSEQIQIVGWSESGRLVYVKIAAGMSVADPDRHRLMSFNNNDYSDVKELASSNSFNDVLMAAGRVYYAPSNIFGDNPNPAMYAVNPDGSDLQTILDKEAYNIFRSSYDKLDISIGASWFSYALGSKDMASPSQAPTSQYSRVYADNPKLGTSLWVDTRDGKGVLLSYDKANKEEKVLLSRGGLKLPLYWLNEKYVIFRLNDGKETADYILNTEGGDPRKIADVTDTNGVDRWYYY